MEKPAELKVLENFADYPESGECKIKSWEIKEISNYVKFLEETNKILSREKDKETLHDKYIMSVLPAICDYYDDMSAHESIVKTAVLLADEAIKQRNK